MYLFISFLSKNILKHVYILQEAIMRKMMDPENQKKERHNVSHEWVHLDFKESKILNWKELGMVVFHPDVRVVTTLATFTCKV